MQIVPEERWPDSNSSFERLLEDLACTIAAYFHPSRRPSHSDGVVVYEFVWRLRQRIEAGRPLYDREQELLLEWISTASARRGSAVDWEANSSMEGIASQCAHLLLAWNALAGDVLWRMVPSFKDDAEMLRRLLRHPSSTVELWREIAATNQHPRVLSFFARSRAAKDDPVLRGYILLNAFDQEREAPQPKKTARSTESQGPGHVFNGGTCVRCGKAELMATRFGWSCR